MMEVKLKLATRQLDAVAKYLGDISKLIFVATVLGFFIPTSAQLVSPMMFAVGIITTIGTFIFSVYLLK